MKKYLRNLVLVISGSALTILPGCRKEISISLPQLNTSPLVNLTSISAECGGIISSDGGAPILERGVCWNTDIHPQVSNNCTSDGEGIGGFSSFITGLTSGTDYFVRAYATNSEGTAYGNEFHFLTPVIDSEGNVYKTIIIGEQVWMAENLKATRFRDTNRIPNVTDNFSWLNTTSPGYCWYGNDETSYKKLYGALYNWFAVNTGKLCPAGWHVPSEEEWLILTNYLGGEDLASGRLKEQGLLHWKSPNLGATNDYGFSALPGGFRTGLNTGSFRAMGYIGWWWSQTESDISWARNRTIAFDAAEIAKGKALKRNGYSVRCVKDN